MQSGFFRRPRIRRKAIEFVLDSVVGGAVLAAAIAAVLGMIVLYAVEL